MALHLASYSITTDAFGYGEDDVRLRPVSSTRPFKLTGVTFDSDDGDGDPALCIRELDEDTDDSGVVIYTDGDQLWFTTTPYGSVSDQQFRTPTIMQPRVEAYDVDGDWASSVGVVADIVSTHRNIRVEVTSGGSAKTYTGTLFYETAGDFRF